MVNRPTPNPSLDKQLLKMLNDMGINPDTPEGRAAISMSLERSVGPTEQQVAQSDSQDIGPDFTGEEPDIGPNDVNKAFYNLISNLAGNTEGKGTDDDVPAVVDNKTPAALSKGEFVIPADVVSHLGDGNTKSGAKVLDSLIKNIREFKADTSKGGKLPKSVSEMNAHKTTSSDKKK